jgi:hypothetical protein
VDNPNETLEFILCSGGVWHDVLLFK